jgi:dipeptidyl aminopeptidase/acylaminoacyl peptidase
LRFFRAAVSGRISYFDRGSVFRSDQRHGHPVRVYDTRLYRVPLKGGNIDKLTDGEGQHRIQFSPSTKFFIDTYSSASRPPVTELRSADGRKLQTLAETDISKLKESGWFDPLSLNPKAPIQ